MNYQIAADLNNLGGAYLQIGHLKKSMELFRDALRYTLVDLHPPQQCTVGYQQNGMVSDPRGTGKSCNQMEASTSPSPLMTGVSSPPTTVESAKPSSTSVPFVHAHAINVIPAPYAYSPDYLVNATVVSSIILFNLGIVYHLKGLDGRGEPSSRLVKARSLYQKSQLLLADAGVPSASTGNPVIDMLSMALYNNLAQASFELLAYKDSKHYFESLIRFALTVVPSRYGDVTIANMVDQQKSNFLLNAIILHAPKLAAAA